MTAPRITPGIDPIPPMMTTATAKNDWSKVNVSGDTIVCLTAKIAPAKPAQTAPDM